MGGGLWLDRGWSGWREGRDLHEFRVMPVPVRCKCRDCGNILDEDGYCPTAGCNKPLPPFDDSTPEEREAKIRKHELVAA